MVTLTTMRVLVAEDHVELAASVARVLRREGMAVDVVHDGEAAIERTSLLEYDVVVLDRDLPPSTATTCAAPWRPATAVPAS